MPSPRAKLVTAFVLALAQAAALTAQGSSVRLPAPTGAFAVGVLDFEFVDGKHPSRRESDRAGRRLMARVWYPAAGVSGQPRAYMEGREFDVLVLPLLEALSVVIQDPTLFDTLAGAATHSHEGAPVAGGGPFPALVFSHGGLSYVSQNTVLMEDLASHGYVVFSVAHPGGSSGVLFPDGTTVTYDQDWRDAVMGAAAAPDPDGRYSPDVGKRHGAVIRSGNAGRVDGPQLSETINTFVRAFFDHHLKGAANGYPESVLTEFPDVSRFDLPQVRAWAASRQR